MQDLFTGILWGINIRADKQKWNVYSESVWGLLP
jgi:hypothetical protein